MNEKTDNITVGESALKVVVPKKISVKDRHHAFELGGTHFTEMASWDKDTIDYAFKSAIDKTLSTPLPDVNDCVELDVEKIEKVIRKIAVLIEPPVVGECTLSHWKCSPSDLAKAIVNDKSILKWSKEE